MKTILPISCPASLLIVSALAVPAMRGETERHWSGDGNRDRATKNWSATSGGPYDTAWIDGGKAVFEGEPGKVALAGGHRPGSLRAVCRETLRRLFPRRVRHGSARLVGRPVVSARLAGPPCWRGLPRSDGASLQQGETSPGLAGPLQPQRRNPPSNRRRRRPGDGRFVEGRMRRRAIKPAKEGGEALGVGGQDELDVQDEWDL